jgi:hypothetical protein
VRGERQQLVVVVVVAGGEKVFESFPCLRLQVCEVLVSLLGKSCTVVLYLCRRKKMGFCNFLIVPLSS